MDIDIEVLDELKFEHQDRIPKLIYHGEFMNPYYDYEDMDSYYIWIAKVKQIRYVSVSFILQTLYIGVCLQRGVHV